MLQISGISKSFGPNRVLDKVSFHVNKGEKIALVGPNGSGKSTLLKIIVGEIKPDLDTGSFRVGPGERLCYLRQGFASQDASVEIAACSAIPGASAALGRVRTVERQLGTTNDDSDILERYSEALGSFEKSGGQYVLDRLDASLRTLGLNSVNFETPLSALSGGQKSRVALAGIVAAEPDILLLDEPTNHLDLPALEWLESFVTSYRGAALIVSHDRLFLDRAVTAIVEIQPDGKVERFEGNYQEFTESKDARRAAQLDRWRAQEVEVKRIRADIAAQKQAADNMAARRKPKGPEYKYWAPENTAKVIARRAKTRESKLERYEGAEDRIEKPKQQWKMKLDLDTDQRSGDLLISIDSVRVSYDESNTIYESLTAELRHGERIALMGPNGSGKSTLFKLLQGELQASAGTVRFGTGVTVGYMPQDSPHFDESGTPLAYIRTVANIPETEARNFLHFFLFQGDQVFTPIAELSYGERARLTLSGIVVKKPNLLLLDEPLNHLDIPARERFEEALDQYPGSVVAATHDRVFVDSYATSIWWVEQKNGTSQIRRFIDRRELEASGAVIS